MPGPPRAVRPLPSAPAPESERGILTSEVTRIVLVATAVLGQLWALTVALEASLLDHDGEAWLLAGFSIVSFVVVLLLTRFDPPPRDRHLTGRAADEAHRYVPRPVEDGKGR